MVTYKLNATLVDWMNEDSYIFINPRLGKSTQQLIKLNKIPNEPGVVWVASSGTTSSSSSSIQLIALKKSAFLASARAVCDYLKLGKDDVWLNVLPRFHVGGLSIEARAFVGGFTFINDKMSSFSSEKLSTSIKKHKASVVSLVPTQVFEIVKDKIKCPESLKFALVGGGHLLPELRAKAIELKWPILTTYGMTELCSQVATESLDSRFESRQPSLQVLPHIDCQLSPDGKLMVKSESLYWGKILFDNRGGEFQQRNQEWFETRDLVTLDSENKLDFKGRSSSIHKVSGELVNLDQLTSTLNSLVLSYCEGKNINRLPSLYLNAVPNLKYESQINLYVEGVENLFVAEMIREKYNGLVAPYERAMNIIFLKKFERTDLGKIKKYV